LGWDSGDFEIENVLVIGLIDTTTSFNPYNSLDGNEIEPVEDGSGYPLLN
jgi:hypothetical protein